MLCHRNKEMLTTGMQIEPNNFLWQNEPNNFTEKAFRW
ncbi:unnamed protein product [Larinioides sclopetarius]|uniref:Uncharacterized protein n=1 Tax=Larinioides sclopetarius TaxID=280406 RepID=A0AAV2B0U8_9ARAC